MGTKSVLSDREDIKAVQEEEKMIFIFTVLSQSLNEEILSEVLPDDGFELTVQQKIKLRQICSKFNIKIVDDFDGGVDIFVQGQLIARWFKPWVVLRVDPKEPDRNKRFHAEIQMKWWLISEENNGQEDSDIS